MTLQRVAFILCMLASNSTAHALDISHLPPNARTSLGVVTMEVKCPEAKNIRLLTTQLGTGITFFNLINESGVFRVRLRGKEILGKRYRFQIKSNAGKVYESEPYMVTDDAALGEQDVLTGMRLTVNALDRRIAAQRRELAMLRAQPKILAVGTGVGARTRIEARELLESGGVK